MSTVLHKYFRESGKKISIFDQAKNKLSKLFNGSEKEVATSAAQTAANKAETESEKQLAAAKGETAVASATKSAAEVTETGVQTTETGVTATQTAVTWELVKAKLAAAKAFLFSPAGIAIIAAVTVAVIALLKVYNKWKNSADQVIKEHKKLREELKNNVDALKEEADQATEDAKALEELADSYRDAVAGSDEFYELANKIAELEPSLVLGYTSNGDAILADTEAIYDQIEAYKELREEKIAAAKEGARDLISGDVDQYEDTKVRKENIDKQLEQAKIDLDKANEELSSRKEKANNAFDSGDKDYSLYLDEVIVQEGVVAQAQKTYDELLSESKKFGTELKDIESELAENYANLFDDFDESLSDEEQEFEKNIRQFVVGVAKEAKLKPDDFNELYDSAKGVNKELFESLFALDKDNMSHDEYMAQVNKIYDQIIAGLLKSNFELTDDQKLGIKITLGLDDKNFQNQRAKFVDKIEATGIKSSRAKHWYDSLTPEEVQLVEKNIDKFSKVKYLDADNLVESLDFVLEKLKEINKELDNVEFSLSGFEEKENEIESLQSLYNQFVENVEGDKVKVPLDISDVEGLREKWESVVGKEEFEAFELTVTTDGFKKSYQEAFDGMLSKYLSVQIAMQGATAQTAAMMKTQLKMDGVTDESAENFVNAKMAEAKAYEYTETAKLNDNKLTQESVQAYIDECTQLGITTDMMGDYITEAMLADGISLDGDDTWLEQLAEKLKIDIGLLRELRALADPVNSGQWAGAYAGVPADYRGILRNQEANNKKAENDKKYETAQFDFNKAKAAAGGGGKEAGDAYVEAFEKELQELDDLRDAGVISEREYLEKLKALYIKYFANRKEYLKEFKKYEKQYLEGMKSLYESAISAAITVLNDRKEAIEKEKEKAIKALEEERDAQKKVIEERLESLEEERDAMQKANEQRERALNLQKAQYELERANKQRNRLIYKNGQMQYVQDYEEVRNAKENVESTLFDMKIGKLDDEIDDLNKQLDEIDKKYDKLIEDTEKFYDKQIEEVQDMIDMWEELQHETEMAEAIANLHEVGLTTEDILSGNMEKFAEFKEAYIGTLTGLSKDVESVAEAFGISVEEAESLKGALLGYDEATQQFSELGKSIDGIASAASDAASALGGGGGTSTGTSSPDNSSGSSGGGEGGGGSGTPQSSSGSGTLSDSIDEVVSKHEDLQTIKDDFGSDEDGIKGAVNEAGEAIAGDDESSLINRFVKLKESAEENVRPVVTTFQNLRDMIAQCVGMVEKLILKQQSLQETSSTFFGTANVSGTAYAGGNWSAKSKGANGVALTGELGTEIVVDSKTGRWHTVGDNGAEFAQIKPNDIVFNHKQTEALLKNGKINSRGKAYASGNNNKFTALSSEELSRYNKLDFTKDLAEKLDFGNQKLMNIDKTVSTITNSKTVNNNPVINITNPTFTCTGVTGEEVLHQIEQSFAGLFTNAYQTSMKR